MTTSITVLRGPEIMKPQPLVVEVAVIMFCQAEAEVPASGAAETQATSVEPEEVSVRFNLLAPNPEFDWGLRYSNDTVTGTKSAAIGPHKETFLSLKALKADVVVVAVVAIDIRSMRFPVVIWREEKAALA
jgi:hypothetical protein